MVQKDGNMLNYKIPFTLVFVLSLAAFASESQQVFKELIPNFDPTQSQVSIRIVQTPSLAALDYAAYHNSPLRYKPANPQFTAPAKTIQLKDLTYNNRIKNMQTLLSQTPLTQQEQSKPMAWAALKNRIWENLPYKKLIETISTIESYKWSDSTVYQQYQEVTEVFLHQTTSEYEIWVTLEMAPWATFLPGMQPSPNSNRKVYAQVVNIPAQEVKAIGEWIQKDYQNKILSYEEVQEWSQVLSSYWYPTLNTDLAPVQAGQKWPNEQTEKPIQLQSQGVTVEQPDVIIKGNPLGEIIYQIIEVPAHTPPKESKASTTTYASKMADRSMPQNYLANMEKIAQELKEHQDDWNTWQEHITPAHKALDSILRHIPKEQMAIPGKNNWLFFRRSLEYSVAGDLSNQPAQYNSMEHLIAFKNWLEENEINMLFVPIPPKNEVYPEQLLPQSVLPADAIINPWGRKFILDAQEEGMEVIDVLPALLQAKTQDSMHQEPLYQRHDTHWTHRGMMVVAQAIAQRIQEYSWMPKLNEVKEVKEIKKLQADTNHYSIQDTSFLRRGDIIERLPSSEQTKYEPTILQAQQVLKNGVPRKGNANAPIILMGDSFTGVYELVDCKHAGVGSHISRLSGIETDIITSWGGGPNVRQKVYRARKNNLEPKRLVIYLMAARDLYNYSQTWVQQSYE
jgi:hypothetical protein